MAISGNAIKACRIIFSLMLLQAFFTSRVHGHDLTWENYGIGKNFDELQEAVRSRNALLKELVMQFVDARFSQEERIRSEGDSGIVKVKNYQSGSQNFHTASHTGWDFANLHDHYGYKNMVGMGESTIVMNGVSFTIKHTDYNLVMPSTTSADFHATEPIEPPPVPKTVTDLADIDAQTAELQEYFRAFRDRNTTHRNYTDYFKPVLCYIEGAWLSDTETVIQASVTTASNEEYTGFKWRDIHEQARLRAHTGALTDNTIASLPRTIISVDEFGIPTFAQWHYRILCQPFKPEEIPPQYLRLVDDLSYRVANNISVDEMYYTKGARFVLDEGDAPSSHESPTLLDKLVRQIPGVDNGHVSITESEFTGKTILDENGQELNGAFYSRRFGSSGLAVNLPTYPRGFNDDNLYVALTRRPEVAPLRVNFQVNERSVTTNIDDIRVTYMLPLEVIYMTPLQEWNPMNIFHYEGDPFEYPASVVRQSGQGSDVSPYNATNDMFFYRTPRDFFSEVFGAHKTLTDNGYGDRSVMDQQNKTHRLTSSGITMVTPHIANDVGPVRLRFPIIPVHGEGSGVWKELNALKTFLAQELSKLGRNLTVSNYYSRLG